MAHKLDLADTLKLFDADEELSEENELIGKIDRDYKESISRVGDHPKPSSIPVNRSSPGFVTPVIGDVGTCKTNSAVMA